MNSADDTLREFGLVDDAVVQALVGVCGREAVSTAEKDLVELGHDKITEQKYASRADVVVYPGSTEEVVGIVNIARARRIPITPRGGGSGLSGGAVPVHGGIVISFSRMNRVLEIDDGNMIVVLEPGVITKELDAVLEPHGLFFAGYPMSEEICQIGGNVAENAGGGRAVKYGVTGDYVLGLNIVTASGELLRFGGRRIKDVTGYDLVGLFVGSEGTLGLITQVTLRLLPRPRARTVVLGFLPEESMLAELTPMILGGLPTRPSSVELADGTCLRLLKSTSKRFAWIPDGSSMILVEFDGAGPDEVQSAAAAVEQILKNRGILEVRRSGNKKEFDEIWHIRKQIPWALMKTSPHQTMEDISVPVTEVWPLIRATRKLAGATGVEIANFGHLGDGNIHCTPIKPVDMNVEKWHRLLDELLPKLYRIAAGLGGTISGEHGIGHKRKGFMPMVFTGPEIAAFQAVKNAFDPEGIMNPGKIV
ncbi:MAG TPA: FAD-linked oxidase C-terminal domain-containing protein [Spirochaetia bacterium]|nr:FAD-linked oxidase C-terminal domain-containing protein [Spirochaetia bacterium]